MTLVFATNNAHKLSEVQAMLGDGITLLSLADIGCQEDIPETGDTLEANASQKSAYIKERYGYDCFADDSGLEVMALHGAPGVYSARYAGTRDMSANIALLLQNMEGIEDRQARFRTVLSLRIGEQEYAFEGQVEGHILTELRGENGFGYDPIFVPKGSMQTFAQMDATAKNAISHRQEAVQKLVQFLKKSSSK
jgi:XTP/dITP diphosphohydrolase